MRSRTMCGCTPRSSASTPSPMATGAWRDRYLAALARWQFACGAPRPNAPLFTKEGEMKDFIALCRESQGKAATAAKATKNRKVPVKAKAVPKGQTSVRKARPKRKK